MKVKSRCAVFAAPIALSVVLLSAAPAARANLTINATFDSSLNATEVAAINTAISQYESTFTNNVSVNIYFNSMTTGLGQSITGFYNIGIPAFPYRAAEQLRGQRQCRPRDGPGQPAEHGEQPREQHLKPYCLLRGRPYSWPEHPGFLDQNGNSRREL